MAIISITGIKKYLTENSGFAMDTNAFFQENRLDIAAHMEKLLLNLAQTLFQWSKLWCIYYTQQPYVSKVGKTLWCSLHHHELNHLYNLYAWYVFEELSTRMAKVFRRKLRPTVLISYQHCQNCSRLAPVSFTKIVDPSLKMSKTLTAALTYL